MNKITQPLSQVDWPQRNSYMSLVSIGSKLTQLKLVPQPVANATLVVARETANKPQTSSSAKVMVICDDPLNIELMRAFLEQFGYVNIVSSCDMSEVFDLVYNEWPDVILFDNMELSNTDFDVLERIRNDRSVQHVPILILTAHAELNCKLKALELRVVDVLLKPITSNELALRLRNILTMKTYHDYIAHYDLLTNLPNRENFIRRLGLALNYSQRYNATGAVLQINLDRFKTINDALGPALGDRLLKAVAERIKELLRESNVISNLDQEDSQITFSRIGGDEFSVLLPVIRNAEEAAIVAQQIQKQLATPFLISDKKIRTTCAIGIAVFPEDGITKDVILNRADISLHRAKQERLGGYKFYSETLNDKSVRRMNMDNEMHNALEENQFSLFYQPKIDVNSKQIVGAEALIRWKHPERGYINPMEFIPLAEETGFIFAIDNWVLNTVCQQIGLWQKAGLAVPRIAVNVSTQQFKQYQLLDVIQNSLENAGIDAKCLTIELTEGAVMSDTNTAIKMLNELKAKGIKISIDDFGTGYSSLSQLKLLPLDELKIDRSFIMDVGKEKNAKAIVLAIISMAHSLGLSVVAEGVETMEQLKFLKKHKCEEYQGYLFSKPVPALDFGLMLSADEIGCEFIQAP